MGLSFLRIRNLRTGDHPLLSVTRIVVEGLGHEEKLKDQPSELLVRIEIRQAYIRAPKDFK